MNKQKIKQSWLNSCAVEKHFFSPLGRKRFIIEFSNIPKGLHISQAIKAQFSSFPLCPVIFSFTIKVG